MIPKYLLVSISAAVAMLAIVAAGWSMFRASPCRDFSASVLTINGRALRFAVARTSEEQAKGLSGCRAMPRSSGMYFPFSEPKMAQFWMKGMFIPLDIVWLSHNRVVGIDRNVEAPSDTKLDPPFIKSPQPVDAVLEINAGEAQALNISPGSVILPGLGG